MNKIILLFTKWPDYSKNIYNLEMIFKTSRQKNLYNRISG